MAKRPAATKARAGASPIELEANARLRACRRWKDSRTYEIRECYFFAAPHRLRQIDSSTMPATAPLKDAPQLYTDFAFLLCADFVTEIVNTYMPEAQQWTERKAGMNITQDVFKTVEDDVKTGDTKIFDAIRVSNLYAELPKAFNPDLAIGTAALWIDRPHNHQAVISTAIPLRELEINLGPYGEIDDRFAIQWTRNALVETKLGSEVWKKVDDKIKQAIAADADGVTELRWGYWRLWNRQDDEVWQHIVMIGEVLVHDVQISGEGCCPLIPIRFNPSADWPLGIGPLLQGLPTLEQVDELERQITEAVERCVNPAITFPDDSITQIEQGIEPGMGYAISRGSKQDIGRIYDQPNVQPELVDRENKEHRLKKLFYVDHPEQTGDTPPTLGQWLDELARMQRRIGMAGYSFWREGPRCIFLRFKYLLEQDGVIKPIADKQGRMISTQPYNPTQRAAEQQEIATAFQYLQMVVQMFPEEAKIRIDGDGTMKRLADKMRVAGERGLIAFRNPDHVAKAMSLIAPLLQARTAGGAPAQATPGTQPQIAA